MYLKFIFSVLIGTICFGPVLAYAKNEIQNMPINSLAWTTTPEGVAFAPLIGDRFKQSYMAMVKLPAGLVSPVHTKTPNMFGVIISGAMVHSAFDVNPKDVVILPVGSFYKIPKNVAHVSKCVSTDDCITFLYQDGKFDFIPTEIGTVN
jgi:hypothetical protein